MEWDAAESATRAGFAGIGDGAANAARQWALEALERVLSAASVDVIETGEPITAESFLRAEASETPFLS